jgi:streptogramin lyase
MRPRRFPIAVRGRRPSPSPSLSISRGACGAGLLLSAMLGACADLDDAPGEESVSTTSAALTLAGDDIIVSDLDTNAVIRVNPTTGAQDLVAQGGLISGPSDVALDVNGDILVITSGATRVVRINPATGAQTADASGSSITGVPVGIAVDRASGFVYLADVNTQCGLPRLPCIYALTQFDPATGNHPALVGGIFTGLSGVAVASGGVTFATGWISTSPNAALFRADVSNGVRSTTTSGGNLYRTSDAVVEADGRVAIIDSSVTYGPTFGGVIRVTPATGAQQVLSQAGNFQYPVAIDVGAAGALYVADRNADAVIRVDATTGAQLVVSQGNLLTSPNGIAVVPSARIFRPIPHLPIVPPRLPWLP